MRALTLLLIAASFLAAQSGGGFAQSKGAAAPPASATPAPDISADQKDKIRQSVKNAKVDHAAKLDLELTVGAEVPRNLHFYPFPKEVAEIAPEYGDYFYVVAAEKIVVIDPLSYRIVAILPV